MIFLTLEHIFTHLSFSIVSIVILIHLITLLVNEIIGIYDSLEKGMISTFLCISGLLINRWIFLRHLPLSNLYESLIFLSWNLSILYMIPYLKKEKRGLNTIMVPSVIFTQGFATSGLLTEIDQSEILLPVLQSYWLMMHVSMMVLSYATLLCGSLLSVALLFIKFQKKIRIRFKRNILLSETFSHGKYIKEKNNFFENTRFLSSINYYRRQLIYQLDLWSFRIISLGFTLLTIGILSGAVWANEAWGSYWNWDPKEIWAFITWIIFLIYLHIRKNKKDEGISSAIISSIGFFIIWVCYFGINLLGIGLHSYGSFTSN